MVRWRSERIADGKTIQAEGADQGALNQWDGFLKVFLFRIAAARRGLKARTIHGGHAVDALGRDPERVAGKGDAPEVIHEFHTPKHEPGWFAGLDAMPPFTLLAQSPHELETYLKGKKFKVAVEQILKGFAGGEKSGALNAETEKDFVSFMKAERLPTQIPKTIEDSYKTLTQGNWRGIASDATTSIGAYTFGQIRNAQRKLTQYLTSSVAHAVPKEERSPVFERARGATISSGRGSRLRDVTDEAHLPEATKIIFEDVMVSLPNDWDTDDQVLEWADTWSQFDLLENSGKKTDGIDPFTLFDWYVRHRPFYDRAQARAAQNMPGDHQILPLNEKKGETPFWLIVDGKRSKLYLQPTSLRFADKEIPLEHPITSHEDIARIVKEKLEGVQSVKLAPSAIPLSMQWMGRSHYLLPEGGSTYVPQVDNVLSELVMTPELTLKDLKDVIPRSRIRVHPHAVEVLPDTLRVKLPPHLVNLFAGVIEIPEDGIVDGNTIKRNWKQAIAQKRDVLTRLGGQKLEEQVHTLFGDSEYTETLLATLREAREASVEKENAVARRGALEKAIVERLRMGHTGKVTDEMRKRETRITTEVGMFLVGKKDHVEGLSEGELVMLEALKPAIMKDAQLRPKEELARSLLQYATLMKIRSIQGGIDALEHWNKRPSLLTTYLLGGEEAVHLLLDKNTRAEITFESPEIQPGVAEWYSVRGNKLLIYEDRTGRFADDFASDFREQLVAQVRERGGDSLIVLLPPVKDEADVKMLVIEKDGTESVMCGNGVAAIMEHYNRKYQKSSIVVESILGETVSASVSQDAREEVRVDMLYPADMSNAAHILETLRALLKRKDVSVIGARTAGGEPHVVCEVHDEHLFDDNRFQNALIPVARKFTTAVDSTGAVLFPEGINVTFVYRTDDTNIRTVTYERGVNDFTASCGTGTLCSAALAVFDKNSETAHADVLTRSGETLTVDRLNGALRLSTKPQALDEYHVK